MLFDCTKLKLIFTIDMNGKKLLHVRFCGDAAANYNSLLVSFANENLCAKCSVVIDYATLYLELILKTSHYRFYRLLRLQDTLIICNIVQMHLKYKETFQKPPLMFDN